MLEEVKNCTVQQTIYFLRTAGTLLMGIIAQQFFSHTHRSRKLEVKKFELGVTW